MGELMVCELYLNKAAKKEDRRTAGEMSKKFFPDYFLPTS